MRRGWIPVMVVVAVVVGVSLWFGLRSSTPTTTSTTTSTTAVTSTATAVWPTAGSGIRYQTPRAATAGFAREFLQATSPVIGAFRQGDTRSGEVPLHTTAGGPETTVLVRQLTSDNSWYVIGAATSAIRIATPSALSRVTTPLAISGTSTAFEAVVNVTVRDDVRTLATTTTQGGSNGVMAPFHATVSFTAPQSSYGDLVMTTRSAKDGSVTAASVVRIRFG